jgi:hypothetical protein
MGEAIVIVFAAICLSVVLLSGNGDDGGYW